MPNSFISRIVLAFPLFLGYFVLFSTSLPTLLFGNPGAPPYTIEDLNPPTDEFAWIRSYKRPDGPPRVGLQIGHWQNSDLPEELSRLIGSTGSSWGKVSETDAMMAIAEEIKPLLEQHGIVVDLIPATIPIKYEADAFIALHADGSTSSSSRGFKASPPRRDFSEQASTLMDHVLDSYAETTKLPQDDQISRAMRGYYAFAWWRYDHAVHPMTPSIILETGFLTSPADRKIIVSNPKLSARGIADGIIAFLKSRQLLS